MPLSNYDQEFGGKPGAATKAYKNITKEYPGKKGVSIFYATKNKRKKQLGLADTVTSMRMKGSLK